MWLAGVGEESGCRTDTDAEGQTVMVEEGG